MKEVYRRGPRQSYGQRKSRWIPTFSFFIPGTPVKGPTRKTSLSGDDNALQPLAVVYIESVLTFDDALVVFDDPWVTFDGYYYTMASQVLEQTSPDDNDVEELAGAPRAVMVGSGKNSVEGI